MHNCTFCSNIFLGARSATGAIGWRPMWDDVAHSTRRRHPIVAPPQEEPTMSKRARKRRSRKGNAANHGKKPNT
jgi:hypothetical protein